MAYPTQFVLALFIFLSTASIGQGLIIDGKPIKGFTVGGKLFCSANGNPVPGANSRALPDAKVAIRCNIDGATTVVAKAVTNSTGAFVTAVVNTTFFPTIDLTKCAVIVMLPVSSDCPLLPNSGNLEASLSTITVLQTLLGFIAEIFSGAWKLVA